MQRSLLILVFLQATLACAQQDTLKKLTFSAYGEVYYSYDFARPQNHEKENFIFNHKRHNEISANILIVKAAYSDQHLRANLGLMAGDYSEYNLSSEPIWARFIYEANIGVKLSKNHHLWLDAGILPSHIGFESAVSADCWTLTRSILAEKSPYYEAGLKLSFRNRKENLTLALLVLNGWQRIRKADDMQNPSFGFQINYQPAPSLTLNYSNFIGSDKPDSLHSFRTFHNLYLQYDPQQKFGVIAGFDFGSDKFNTTDYGIWFSPVVILRYTINETFKIALRGEYYDDKKQILITTATLNGFQVSGVSANFDYKINKKVEYRIEGKVYHAGDKIFSDKKNDNYMLTTSLTMRL